METRLDCNGFGTENLAMNIRGHVHNGVVILDGLPYLPEGAVVTVLYPVAPAAEPELPRRRIRLPLVRSRQPGAIRLTPERIAELLDDEDVSA